MIIIASIFLLQSSVYADDTAFSSSSSSQTIGDITTSGGTNSEFNDNENTNKKSVSEVQADDKGIDKDEVNKHYQEKDIDYMNAKVLSNYKPYYKDAGITDFSRNAAHVLAELFSSINRDIIYTLFDKALSVLFNLTNIQNSTNTLFNKAGKFNNSIWTNQSFKMLIYVAFAGGIVWAFITEAKNHGGLKSILTIVIIFIVGSAWIGGGGLVLEKINNATSIAEVTAFQATSSDSDQTTNVADFQHILRFQFFQEAIERPFYLENFNTTKDEGIDTKKMGDPIDFIRGAIQTSDDVPDKNPNMLKDSKKSWYQSTVAFTSLFSSTAYGIPLFFIGLFNLGLQFASVILYFFAPFAILISLLPKYANSGIKTALGAVGVLFGKVFLVFGIMLLNWVQYLADAIVPPTDSGGAMLNAIIYVTLMFILWKNKGRLFNAISGSSAVGSIADKAHVRAPINEMKQQYGNAKKKLQNGGRRAKNVGKRAKKFKDWTEDTFGEYDDPDEPDTRKKPARNTDPDEARRLEEARRLARQEPTVQQRGYENHGNKGAQPTNKYGRDTRGGSDFDEANKAKKKRISARSYVIKRPEYTGEHVDRDESKKRRANRNKGV